MIVICAKDDDPHVQSVASILRSNHSAEVSVFDMSRYPGEVFLTGSFNSASHGLCLTLGDGRPIDLTRVRSFWWRRPQPLSIDPRIGDSRTRDFAYQECISALYGALHSSEGLWVNDLNCDSTAEYKLFQLKVAANHGFSIPETLISNEPQEVLEFWQRQKPDVVYKAFNQRGLVWRPTRRLEEHDLALIDTVRHAPVIFQSLVPGVADVRITVIGEQVFASEFDIRAFDGLDYRADMHNLPCRPHDLPAGLADSLRGFMCALGLEYGGVDFRVTPDGEYIFFEINTAGEFIYIQERTGQPIAEAMAAHLARGRRVNVADRPEEIAASPGEGET